MSSSSRLITNVEELKELRAQHPLLWIRFGAEWCKPCRDVKPFWDELVRSRNLPDAHVDIDLGPDLRRMFNVAKIPTFICMLSDRLYKYTGADEAALTEWVDGTVAKALEEQQQTADDNPSSVE